MINAHPHSSDTSTPSTGSGASSTPPANPGSSSFSHSAEIKNDLNSSFGGSQAGSSAIGKDSIPGTHPSHSSSEVSKNEPVSGFHSDSASTNKPGADTVPTNTGFGSDNSSNNSFSHSNKPTGTSGLKNFGLKKIAGVAILLLLVIGSGAAYYLQTQNQDVRQQAAYYQWEKKLKSGLTVELPNCGADCKPETDFLNSGSISGYKPMSANVSDSNYKPGDTVNFKVPVKNTTSNAISDQYSFKVFKITEYRENGQWIAANDKTAKSESEMYWIHKNNGEGGADGTKQTRVHNGSWEQVTVQPGQTMNFAGSWKPGSSDCGIYQIDMFASPTKNDSDYTNIIGAGFIRVTGCEAPQDAICRNVTLSKTTAIAGENITVNIEASNIRSHSFNYLSTAIDACQISQWKKANVVQQLPGVYTWNTSGLTPGEYHLSVDSTDNNGTFCGGNPGGTCGYDVKSCPNCNAKITIVAPTPTISPTPTSTQPTPTTLTPSLSISCLGCGETNTEMKVANLSGQNRQVAPFLSVWDSSYDVATKEAILDFLGEPAVVSYGDNLPNAFFYYFLSNTDPRSESNPNNWFPDISTNNSTLSIPVNLNTYIVGRDSNEVKTVGEFIDYVSSNTSMTKKKVYVGAKVIALGMERVDGGYYKFTEYVPAIKGGRDFDFTGNECPCTGSGPQCVALCATTSAAGCQPTAPNDGTITGTPKIGDTVYFNCAYSPSAGVNYLIEVYKDGQVVKSINGASGNYKIESAGAFGARCRNNGT